LAKSMLLYSRCNLDIESASEGRRRLFVRFDQVLNNWRVFGRRLRVLVGAGVPIPSSGSVREIESFLTTDYYRNRYTRDELVSAPNVDTMAIEIYDRLSEVADSDRDVDLRRSFDGFRQTLAKSVELSLGQVAPRPDLNAAAIGGFEQVGQLVNRALSLAAEARSDLARQLEEANRKAASLDDARVELSRQVLKLERQARDAEKLAQEQKGEITALGEQIERLQTTVLAVKASTSWRITSPLRSVKRLLGHMRQPAELSKSNFELHKPGIRRVVAWYGAYRVRRKQPRG